MLLFPETVTLDGTNVSNHFYFFNLVGLASLASGIAKFAHVSFSLEFRCWIHLLHRSLSVMSFDVAG